MILWWHMDDTFTVVDEFTEDESLLRVMLEARGTIKGTFPSINSLDTIDAMLDLTNEL